MHPRASYKTPQNRLKQGRTGKPKFATIKIFYNLTQMIPAASMREEKKNKTAM